MRILNRFNTKNEPVKLIVPDTVKGLKFFRYLEENKIIDEKNTEQWPCWFTIDTAIQRCMAVVVYCDSNAKNEEIVKQVDYWQQQYMDQFMHSGSHTSGSELPNLIYPQKYIKDLW
jgi:hypothetical protein